MELLTLEEQQFQEYANKVIEHCEKGGRNTIPLRKAAQVGIGGGKGPVFNGELIMILSAFFHTFLVVESQIKSFNNLLLSYLVL